MRREGSYQSPHPMSATNTRCRCGLLENPSAPTTSPNPSHPGCLVPQPHIKITPFTGHSIRGEWPMTAPSNSYVEMRTRDEHRTVVTPPDGAEHIARYRRS